MSPETTKHIGNFPFGVGQMNLTPQLATEVNRTMGGGSKMKTFAPKSPTGPMKVFTSEMRSLPPHWSGANKGGGDGWVVK